MMRRVFYFLAIVAGVFFTLVKIVPIFVFPSDTKDDTYPPSLPPSSSVGTIVLWAPERPVSPGEELSGVRFKELYWPHNQVPEDAVKSIAETDGMRAKIPLSTQVPLQRIHLTKDASKVVFPVTRGNRAVTIEVENVTESEESILPGALVDLLLIQRDQHPSTPKVLVQNARVLAGWTGKQSSMEEANQSPSRSITLDVTSKDAIEIQNARALGTFRLRK